MTTCGIRAASGRNFFARPPIPLAPMPVKDNYYISRLLWGFCIALSLATPALADECVVASNTATGAGSLSDAIQKAERGDCQTTLDDVTRQKYETYTSLTPTVHVVHIPKSAVIDLIQALPEVHAAGHETVIIRADSGATVQITGTSYTDTTPPMHLTGTDGTVIIDHIGFQNFTTTPVVVDGQDHLLIGVSISQSGSASLPALRIIGTHITVAEGNFSSNTGDALLVDDALDGFQCVGTASGSRSVLAKNAIAQNGGVGIHLHAPLANAHDNDIHHNHGAGIVVDTVPGNSACTGTTTTIYTAEMRRNLMHGNADGITITANELVPPVDLIEVSAPTSLGYRIIGNIGRNPAKGYPWDDAHLDLKNAVIDIYVTDSATTRQASAYVASTTVLDVQQRLFVATIPKPLVVNGQTVDHPIFVATLTDPEHHNSSRYSDALDVEATRDWDNDGIPNDEELSIKTDPRLKDSDGDGLTDGEEVLHKPGYEEMLQKALDAEKLRKEEFLVHDHVVSAKIQFKDLSHLDPTLSDSDEDCLPDGLELGVALFEFPAVSKAHQYSVLQAPSPTFSTGCLALLQAHKLYTVDLTDPTKNELLLKNVLLNDPKLPATLSNIRGLFDTDPSTKTDPTNKDTDSDHLMDGAEDWNWNGAIDKKEDVVVETDPLKPDSDSDGLMDGDEDKNGNGIVDKDETSPLLPDTDHDGVGDAQEVKSGANATNCDSDGDGEPDGIENNVANIDAPQGCPGMPASGTNFANPKILSSTKADSDGDGLLDGEEDKNHNGWLDPDESDPTTPDTDGDGISDYVEMTGDVNHDGTVDFFVGDINNGAKCNPATNISDVDCDGLSNAQDTDSDNDGCPDKIEGIDAGNNAHGIPAAYTRESKQCGASAGGGAISAGGSAKPSGDSTDKPTSNAAPTMVINSDGSTEALGSWNAPWANRADGGGDCSLLPSRPSNPPNFSLFFLAALTGSMLVTARNFLRPKS